MRRGLRRLASRVRGKISAEIYVVLGAYFFGDAAEATHMNPIKQFFAKLDLFKGGHEAGSVVGVDIGSSSIKVVELRKKGGRAELVTYGTLSLGPYGGADIGEITNLSVEQISKALTDVIRESGVTTRSGAVAIPSAASLVFVLELPAVIDEKQLGAIVPTEARKYIPVPITEVSLDFWVIPKKEESIVEGDTTTLGQASVAKTEVLVAAIHNDTITKYKDIVGKTDLSVSFFEIETFSGVRSNFNRELGTVLLVDFGASKTKLTIIEYGIVRSFHIVTRGSVDITRALSQSLSIPFARAEEIKREFGLFGSGTDKNVAEICKLSADYIISETKSVMYSHEKKYNKTINKVILSGGGSLLKGFFEAAKDAFSAEVTLGNPYSKVHVPGYIEGVLRETGPEFSVAVGLALRELGA